MLRPSFRSFRVKLPSGVGLDGPRLRLAFRGGTGSVPAAFAVRPGRRGSTVEMYAGAAALYLRWCEETSREWTTGPCSDYEAARGGGGAAAAGLTIELRSLDGTLRESGLGSSLRPDTLAMLTRRRRNEQRTSRPGYSDRELTLLVGAARDNIHPASATGSPPVKPPHPPITTPAAVLMIGAGYLLFVGRGVLNAIEINRTGQVLPALDYSDLHRRPGHRDPGRPDRRGAAHPLAVLPPPTQPPESPCRWPPTLVPLQNLSTPTPRDPGVHHPLVQGPLELLRTPAALRRRLRAPRLVVSFSGVPALVAVRGGPRGGTGVWITTGDRYGSRTRQQLSPATTREHHVQPTGIARWTLPPPLHTKWASTIERGRRQLTVDSGGSSSAAQQFVGGFSVLDTEFS